MNRLWIAVLNATADRWAESMQRACLQGGLAVLLVWLIVRLLPRLSPPIRCLLWGLAYLKMLVAFLWTAPLELPLLSAPEIGAPTVLRRPIHAPASRPKRPIPFQRAIAPARPPHVPAAPSLSINSVLMAAWLLGVVWIGGETARRHSAAYRLRREATPVTDVDVLTRYLELRRTFGIRNAPPLLSIETVCSPLALGMVRPAVIVPRALLTPEQTETLTLCLAHELAHIQRRDLFWNILPAMTHLLFYFHPMIWLANREWGFAQEAACDAQTVLLLNANVADYGAMLVRLAAQQRRSPGQAFATLSAADSPQTLKRRLTAMKSIAAPSPRRLAIAAIAGALLGIVGVVPWQVTAQGVKGDRLLIVSNRDGVGKYHIYAMNPDGSGVTRVTKGDDIELDPAWSPDHKKIAYSIASLKENAVNIYVMKPDGTQRVKITDFGPKAYALSPVWSPDGKQLVYTVWRPRKPAYEEGQWSGEIHLMDADGMNSRTLSSGLWAAWSPDGKKIAYAGFYRKFPHEASAPTLFVMDADGSNQSKIVETGTILGWSQDGKRLIYSDDDAAVTYSADANGANSTPLLKHPGFYDFGQQWASDGKHIYFTRTLQNNGDALPKKAQIYVMNADGSQVKPLTKEDTLCFFGAGTGFTAWLNWINPPIQQ